MPKSEVLQGKLAPRPNLAVSRMTRIKLHTVRRYPPN